MKFLEAHGQGLSFGRCNVCRSAWYIYWACNSGDDRDSQLLEVWSNRVGLRTLKTVSYPEAKAMLADGDFSEIPGHQIQTDRLRTAVEQWVADVEDDYPVTAEKVEP